MVRSGSPAQRFIEDVNYMQLSTMSWVKPARSSHLILRILLWSLIRPLHSRALADSGKEFALIGRKHFRLYLRQKCQLVLNFANATRGFAFGCAHVSLPPRKREQPYLQKGIHHSMQFLEWNLLKPCPTDCCANTLK